MKTQITNLEAAQKTIADKAAKSGSVRCNHGHSGNTRLTFDVGYFQCDGCGYFHTVESVLSAARGPVESQDGSGGTVRIAV